jgi:aspartyl protease family protein
VISSNAQDSFDRIFRKAARTRLAMVDVGGLVVRDVDAMVLPDEALSENLLGLSFLSKLKRFEFANGQMVLEQ